MRAAILLLALVAGCDAGGLLVVVCDDDAGDCPEPKDAGPDATKATLVGPVPTSTSASPWWASCPDRGPK